VNKGPEPAEVKAITPMAQIKTANLALQGGGAHGAFTWGVLDRLLEESRFQIDGVSATSAGAMNAVVLAHGLTVGGRKVAKEALANFWRKLSKAASQSIVQPSWFDRLVNNHSLEHSPAAGCQLNKLFAPGDQQWIWHYDECADATLRHSRKSGVELISSSRGQHFQAPLQSGGRCPDVR
jgi:hypothetical protein